jgi:L-ascorbate metabolism protein UlaG (beta-lactamase superfamily)
VPDDRLTWLGHASVLVELDGVRLLTDPVLRTRVAHLRRQVPRPAPPGPTDAVLVSHAHRDHLDLPSVRALRPPPARVVVPAGVGTTLRSVPGVPVTELTAGEALDVDGVRVTAVDAVHDTRRTPLGRATAAVGYLLRSRTRRVYFAGDTEVFPAMASLGPIDVALLSIWGWGPTLGPGHMGPEEAARALALLRPAIVVPIHWGTLLPLGLGRRHARVLRDPAAVFARAAAERCPEVRVAVLSPGEDLVL